MEDCHESQPDGWFPFSLIFYALILYDSLLRPYIFLLFLYLCDLTGAVALSKEAFPHPRWRFVEEGRMLCLLAKQQEKIYLMPKEKEFISSSKKTTKLCI